MFPLRWVCPDGRRFHLRGTAGRDPRRGPGLHRLSEALLREPCEPLGAEPVTVDPDAVGSRGRRARRTAGPAHGGRLQRRGQRLRDKEQSGRVLRLRLDPDVSPAYAEPQVRRVASGNKLEVEQVERRVERHTKGRTSASWAKPRQRPQLRPTSRPSPGVGGCGDRHGTARRRRRAGWSAGPGRGGHSPLVTQFRTT
ncbi:potassium-transporting ATPase subunit C [Streptomyces cirratus]